MPGCASWTGLLEQQALHLGTTTNADGVNSKKHPYTYEEFPSRAAPLPLVPVRRLWLGALPRCVSMCGFGKAGD